MTALPSSAPAADVNSHVTDSEKRARLWRLALWMICAFPFSVNVVDPDLWGHVQYARDWLNEGRLPRFATHTFTAVGHPWINHENLSELALALGFGRFGVKGMLCLKFSLGLAMIALMRRAARRNGVSAGHFWCVAVLVAYTLHVFWLFRPQLATWIGLAVLVVILDQGFVTWHRDARVRWKWLCCLPVLLLIWANAHGGFLAGLCLLAAYLAGRATEAFVTPRLPARRYVLLFGLIGLATAAATLLNPYGIGLHAWLIRSLGEPRPEILEWHRPSIWAPVFAPFFVLFALTVTGWTFSNRPRDWTHALVLALAGTQALLHIRHIGLFAVLAGFWIPPHVESFTTRCFGRRLKEVGSDLRRIPWIFSLPVIVILFVVIGRQLKALPVPRDRYPIDAIQFIVDRGLHGRLVVSFNWAQYAIAALQPETTVGFDGRFRTCYPQHIIDKHFDFLLGDVPGTRHRAASSGPLDPTAVLREGDPELVLLDRSFKHSINVMQTQRDTFALLYEDDVAQLWGTRSLLAGPTVVGGKTAEQADPDWPALPSLQSSVFSLPSSIFHHGGSYPPR